MAVSPEVAGCGVLLLFDGCKTGAGQFRLSVTVGLSRLMTLCCFQMSSIQRYSVAFSRRIIFDCRGPDVRISG